jgi:HlyD family secretion protein
MDIIRTDLVRQRTRRRWIYGTTGSCATAAVVWALFSIQGAAPALDKSALWIGDVRRGNMEINVGGLGTLVPEDLRWITAQTAGSVERIHLLPGATVAPATVILQLDNPELRQQLRSARLELASAEAQLANQRVREEDSLLEMEYQLAQLEAGFENARLDVRVNEELFADGLVAERDLLRSRLSLEQLGRQSEILRRRLTTRSGQMEQNLAPALAVVAQQQERVALLERQVDGLAVRAGLAGVLQRLPLQEGQQVATGTQLAQVADPSRLKAVIRVPETQAKDIQIGQEAVIDTRNGTVAGSVARVNPTVAGGTVDVDVTLTGDLPRGARADLTVEGRIHLARLDNTLFISRPSFARENSTISVFQVNATTTGAERVSVVFGRSAVSEIQIVAGVSAGDRLILSDTSQYSDNPRLRLK